MATAGGPQYGWTVPIGPVEPLLEIVAALVPLAADGAAIDLELEGSLVCVAAAHVDPAIERALVGVKERRMPARRVVPFVSERGTRGRLSVWSDGPLAPIAESFVYASAAHAGAVADRSTALEDGLFAMLGHELRAPLQALKLGIELIRIRARDTADDLPKNWVLERCERLETSVDRLRDVADRLLDVTHAQRGVTVQTRDAELGAIVRAAVERFAGELAASATAVRIEQAELVPGAWDVVHVDTIVSNLLSNAMKYAPGSPIVVRVTGDDDEVRVSVRDHGPGIRPEERARIFERFARGSSAGMARGLGIGLWMARLLAEAQGGTLRCEDAATDGAELVLVLPRFVTAQPSIPTPAR